MKKQIAPVIDIFPQIAMEKDFSPDVIRREVTLSAAMTGCKRIYCVTTNPGFPMFSSPWNALLPENNRCSNYALANIRRVGDANALFAQAVHACGCEAFAVFKPYEQGGGRSVAHGAPTNPYVASIEDIGGKQTGYGALLSEHPEYAVSRFPYNDILENEPIVRIELDYLIDETTQREGPSQWEVYARPEHDPSPEEMGFELYVSNDNGVFRKVPVTLNITSQIICQQPQDANEQLIGQTALRFLRVSLSGFSLCERYVAVVRRDGGTLYQIPQSMVRIFCQKGEMPSTATPYVRMSLCPEGAPHVWGNEGDPRVMSKAEDAKKAFTRAGFEFDWHGSGFWGDGWINSAVLCIGRGKRHFLRGTPCEGYPEVQAHWLSCIENLLDMGYDGIDLRLQNHSGMVTDWTRYGWNEPIRARYFEMTGCELDPETADAMDVMRARGSLYMDFVRRAAAMIHARGKKLQLHLRDAWERPVPNHEFNQMAFWAMPKIIPDWREAVDLADEITLKDYHFNHYDNHLSPKVKALCAAKSKPVWIHLYMEQGGEMNEEFLSSVFADEGVTGVLLYEVTHSGLGVCDARTDRGLVSVHDGRVTDQTTAAEHLKTLRQHFDFE